MTYSSSLLWLVLRNHTSKTVKRDGQIMSREKGNLRCMHTSRDSGLSNPRAVNIVAVRTSAKGKKSPAMDLKNTKPGDLRRPTKMWHRNHMKKGARRAIAAASSVVGRYRPDLKKFAAKRMDLVVASLKATHKPVKKGRRSKAI